MEKRIFPTIDIKASGTRREEILLDPEEYRRISLTRRVLADLQSPEAMELLLGKVAQSNSNAEFLMSINPEDTEK